MPKKILIIEDDNFLRLALEKRLKNEGFEIISALNGEEGFQKILTELPDLIILDIILPKKTGFILLEEIIKDPNLKTVPIVIVSQLGQPEDIEKGLKLGAIEYLVKAKVSLDDLVNKIKQYFNKGAGSSTG
ncbi:MAG: response regulator [Patescibacteria group bacterium]